MKQVLVVCVALAACVFGRGAWGQCGEWGTTGGSCTIVGTTGKLVTWDRDGDGPDQPLLVVGGASQVGDIATTLAGWDGTHWHDLRSTDQTLLVPLCAVGADLLCSRSFPRALVRLRADGTHHMVVDVGMSSQFLDAAAVGSVAYVLGQSPDNGDLRRWIKRVDDQGWSELAVDFRAAGVPVPPIQLLDWNGVLVVAGAFDEAGGVPADRIAWWDGDTWEPLGVFPDRFVVPKLGVHQGSLFGVGYQFPYRWNGGQWEVPAASTFPPLGQHASQAAALFSDSGVYMPAYGTFFDGASWQPLDATVMRSPVAAVAWRDTVVCAGYGDINQYRRTLAVVEENALVPLGTGLPNEPRALTDWNGQLVVAGVLGAGGRVATPAVTWDGVAWHNIGITPPNYTLRNSVSGVCGWNGGLLLGHSAWSFSSALMRWDGATWADWQPRHWQEVHALGVVAGTPTVWGRALNDAQRALSRWDGSAWAPIAPPQDAALVSSALIAQGHLVVTGAFAQMAGVAADGLAAWDGQSWTGYPDAPDGLTILGWYRGGPVVRAGPSTLWWNTAGWVTIPAWNSSTTPRFAIEYHGDLVLGQWSTYRWSPEAGLRPMGRDASGTGGEVNRAVVVGENVYFAGTFYQAGGQPAPWLVSWTDTPVCDCDSVDFNRDGLFPDIADVPDFLSVFEGGRCASQSLADEWPCNSDIDFNNDGLFPDTLDIQAFLSVFSGGECLQ